MKILIFKFPGISPIFCSLLCQVAGKLSYDVVGIVSLNPNETETSLAGHRVLPLNDKIYSLSWDVAVCACFEKTFSGILPKMLALKIGTEDQIKPAYWLLKQKMILKYEDCADPVIQETLEYWKTHELSIFNQHIDLSRGTLDRAFLDENCGMFYIYFKTVGGDYRKMYFPNEYEEFIPYNDEMFVNNLMREQDPTSPHLYTTGEHTVREGDILIDAGVAEGNFALKYVDICSKIYLFEPEPRWLKALERTFAPYRGKVELIPRFVSNVTDDKSITIDDALGDVRGKNIFLKMDVEGAEVEALRGAKEILTQNSVRASVCTYHYADELVEVKGILQKYGYRTSTSAGYMVFFYDSNTWNTADFRKGVVYAAN